VFEFCERKKAPLLLAFSLLLVFAVGTAGLFNYFTAYEYSYGDKKLGYVKNKDDVLQITEMVRGALTEDKEMAVRDFAENRYVTFDGVEYELTFMDSFNGHYLDTDKWAYCPEWVRDDCVWKPEGAYLEDGVLILAVTGDKIPYTAGAIRTRDIFEQTYGYWEVRAKLPRAEGINAAFWLMCDGAGHAEVPGGSDGAEIDIIEAPHHDWQQVQHAVHMDGYEDKHKSVDHPMDIAGIYDDAWHTFSLVWTPENYFFYIDGELTWTVKGNWICQVPCYAKLTAAVGGWAGVLDPKNVPVYGMQVDYIKVYLPVDGYPAADS
jgi:beta-glucanase (GH16 family)